MVFVVTFFVVSLGKTFDNVFYENVKFENYLYWLFNLKF